MVKNMSRRTTWNATCVRKYPMSEKYCVSTSSKHFNHHILDTVFNALPVFWRPLLQIDLDNLTMLFSSSEHQCIDVVF